MIEKAVPLIWWDSLFFMLSDWGINSVKGFLKIKFQGKNEWGAWLKEEMSLQSRTK
ncbi:metal-dependent hydrolase [Bacillus sp. SG-1]|nr:metal-dependent hydrolase [Bacillus sp. SG-1]